MKKHYTYIHCTPDGDAFYVGKGVGGRAYSMSDRSIKWKEVLAKHNGILIKIVKWFEAESDAFIHERELIQGFLLAGVTLVNATSGGKGVKDYCLTEADRKHKSLKMRGYVYKKVECPICGKVGGETSMKRWHFNNCTGIHPSYKARITVNGVREYLGKFHTQEEANRVMASAYIANGAPVPKKLSAAVSLMESTVTVPTGSRWIVV